jgi:hypothetical protein
MFSEPLEPDGSKSLVEDSRPRHIEKNERNQQERR